MSQRDQRAQAQQGANYSSSQGQAGQGSWTHGASHHCHAARPSMQGYQRYGANTPQPNMMAYAPGNIADGNFAYPYPGVPENIAVGQDHFGQFPSTTSMLEMTQTYSPGAVTPASQWTVDPNVYPGYDGTAHGGYNMQYGGMIQSTNARSPGPTDYNHPPDGDEQRVCVNCGATTSPLWRRNPQTLQTLCNACGLFETNRGRPRPERLYRPSNDNEDNTPHDGPECSHCGSRKTSVWRRGPSGEQLCNACGVYKRLKGVDRPLELRNNPVRHRERYPPP